MDIGVLFISIFEAIILVVLVGALWQLINGKHVIKKTVDGEKTKRRLVFEKADWTFAATVGLTAGAINFFVPQLGKWLEAAPAWVAGSIATGALAAIIFLMVWIVIRVTGLEGISRIREMIVVAAIEVGLFFTAKAVVMVVTTMFSHKFWDALVGLIPAFALITALVMMVMDYVKFRQYKNHCKSNPETSRELEEQPVGAGWIAVAVGALIALALVLNLPWQVLAAEQAEQSETATEETAEVADEATEVVSEEVETVAAEEVAVETSWYRFHHYDLLKDDDLTDDFNFGKSAYKEDTTAKKVRNVHIKRVRKDLALGVATFATFDVRLGTDFVHKGIHYDQNWSDGYWTTLINEWVQYYMVDEAAYKEAVSRWESFVKKYASVDLAYEKDIEDQMYMISLTADSVLEAPEVIIAKTDQPTGHILTYTFLIKGNEFNVPFRTDCGFQPTNVAEPMKETPQENPNKENPTPEPTSEPEPEPTSEPEPEPTSEPEPEPTSEPTTTPEPTITPEPTTTPEPTPTEEPIPNPQYNKDTNEAPEENTESNDNPNEGENTIDPADTEHSSKDKPGGSTIKPSAEQYNADNAEVRNEGANQQGGGQESYAPQASPDSAIDNSDVDGEISMPSN